MVVANKLGAFYVHMLLIKVKDKRKQLQAYFERLFELISKYIIVLYKIIPNKQAVGC